MNERSKNKLKGTLIVPVGLTVVLIPFSILIGWNLITMIVFWLAIIPTLAIYLPALVSSNKHHLLESLAGLIIFYASMVFMIYDHYKTDYFQVMILSCVINLILVSVIIWAKRPNTQTQ